MAMPCVQVRSMPDDRGKGLSIGFMCPDCGWLQCNPAPSVCPDCGWTAPGHTADRQATLAHELRAVMRKRAASIGELRLALAVIEEASY